jgi:uroporphyrinogen III methyltransferase/synthase
MEAMKSDHPPDVITFTSSSTVRNFVELVGHETIESGLLDSVMLASIGPITSSTLVVVGLRVDVEADEHTVQGLADAISHSL